MSTNIQETNELILKDKKQTQSEPLQFIFAATTSFNSFWRGASSYSSTFSPIAITWHKGLWLVAPVGFGATVSLTDNVVEKLATRYPNNEFLKALNPQTFFAANGVGVFFADFGFAWNIINTLGAYIGGVELVRSSGMYNRYIAPATAVIPALLATRLAYLHKQNKLFERSFMRHAAYLFFGLTAPGGYVGMLEQQGILNPTTYIPSAIILASGVLALLGSLFKESCPQVSEIFLLIITLVCENPSLAASLFHFPNDIYAASHNNSISEPFFYTNVGVSSAFLLILTMLSVYSYAYPQNTQGFVNGINDINEDNILNNPTIAEMNLTDENKQDPFDSVGPDTIIILDDEENDNPVNSIVLKHDEDLKLPNDEVVSSNVSNAGKSELNKEERESVPVVTNINPSKENATSPPSPVTLLTSFGTFSDSKNSPKHTHENDDYVFQV